MQRRCGFAHFILLGIVVLSLTSLMVCLDAQAQIAFVSERDGNFEIYVMGADGKNQRRLTNNPLAEWDPSWSSDGERIAFMANRKGDHLKWDIYVMDADGGNQQKLTNHRAGAGSPSWSPDGKRIVFNSNRDGNSEIYVMDADGGNPRNLSNNDFEEWGPSWSPDGKRIAFTSSRDWEPRNLRDGR